MPWMPGTRWWKIHIRYLLTNTYRGGMNEGEKWMQVLHDPAGDLLCYQ